MIRRALQWREQAVSEEGLRAGLSSSRAAEREIQGSLALRPCFPKCRRNMKPSSKSYIPALGYHRLTWFYDPVVRLTTREATFKEALLRQACIQDGHRILDLGCGTGTLATMIKRTHPSAEVVGLDADPKVLKLARTKLEAAGIEAQLDQGLAYALPYPTESFDRILSSLLFHHLSSVVKRDTMHEGFRVLRSGGEFHIADWGKPTNSAMRLAFVAVQLLDGFATTTDTVKGLLPDFLQLAGFGNVETSEHYSIPFGTLALYRTRKPSCTGEERRCTQRFIG